MYNAPRPTRFAERAELLRQKELQRQIKESAKSNELHAARLEVEAFDNKLAVLLSVHKQASEPIDWKHFAFALPPHAPAFSSRNHHRAFLSSALVDREALNQEQVLQQAWSADEAAFYEAVAKFERDYAEWARLKALAGRILTGDISAFGEAVTEFSSFGEIANLGASIEFKAHNSWQVECVLAVNGQNIIPAETKVLTVSGKLSVKPMSKTRFQEIYQDYVCGCCLRIGREILSLLPVHVVLTTIIVNSFDSSIGKWVNVPVLSVFLDRKTIEFLTFEALDPSDAMRNFTCAGDAKASKKTGEFVAITPLIFQDSDPASPEGPSLTCLCGQVASLRASFKKALKRSALLTPRIDLSADPIPS